MKRILFALALALSVAACEAPSDASAKAPEIAQPAGWKAVLIAGDDHEPAFDNAVDAMAEKLTRFGVPRSNISVLKASAYDSHSATQSNIQRAFAELHPAPTDGCFVFITSHGGEGRGLVLVRDGLFITPAELAGLLNGACGVRPTVVVASGCFAGIFGQGRTVPAANRVILMAARADRPSFGCDAGLRYTIFDQCVLDNMERGIIWSEVMNRARACVSARERAAGDRPSYPQLSVGASAAGLRVFSQ
jgi:peptidase C13-like protein